MTNEERLACAIEAIAAHGDTPRIKDWYAKWKPGHKMPTTVQYSASCFLMDHALQLVGESD